MNEIAAAAAVEIDREFKIDEGMNWVWPTSPAHAPRLITRR
jgi:hypothetical protein